MSRYTRNLRQNMMQQPISRNFVSAQQQQQPKAVSVVSYTTNSAPAVQPTVQQPVPKEEIAEHSAVSQSPDVAMAEGDTPTASDADANGDDTVKPRFPWMKKAPGLRKKPNKKLIQQRLRKHVSPKNATMALQELFPDVKFNFSSMPGGVNVYTAEVEVQGKKFHGVGSNKALARAAASELALQSLVCKPVKTTNEAGRQELVDETPWAALASFALHKLFCDWKRGVIGAPVSLQGVPEASPNGAAAAAAAATAATSTTEAGFASDAPAGSFQSFQPPPRHPIRGDAPKQPPKPRKATELPKNAAERHPVQLLHEMHPDLEYTDEPQTPGQPYAIAVCVDGQKFAGSARNKKLAKKVVCQMALKAIHKVVYPEEETMDQAAA